MKTVRPVLVTLGLALVFGAGLWLGFVVPRYLGLVSNLKTYNTAAILQQVQTVSQLVTVKYVLDKVEILDDARWFGDDRVLLVAHGIVKAGVDLSRLGTGDIQVNDRKILIRLPPAQITDAYLDDKQTRVVDRTTGIWRVPGKDLEETARQNAVDDIRRAAREDGILKDATERAKLQLMLMLHEMGFTDVKVEAQ